MPQLRLTAIDTVKLFSADYLANRLPQRSDWRGRAPEREILAGIVEVYRRAGHLLDAANEAQIRDEVIDPILLILDHHFLADQPLPTGKTPDYTFYRDGRSKQTKAADGVIAVGDAKEPGRDFVKVAGGRSPVMQVYDYMIDSLKRWGILTDGRRWRLLHRDSPSDAYLEVDLYDIATRESSEEWLLFYNLFRQEAFLPRADGRCLLDDVRDESDRYAQAVGEELKERVYEALLELAKGFASWGENRLDPSREEVRERIRAGCFVLLYRLLFVFFAEARGLLPRDAEGYRQVSLEAIRERVRGASRDGSQFLADSRRIWQGLKDLFRLVDQGSGELDLAPYNGGLFARAQEAALSHGGFLERYDVADRYLARAIDLLGTAPSVGDRRQFVSVDYGGLQIRHLGSIYEGLLEYRIGYADTDLVSIGRKGGGVWVPVNEYEGKTEVSRLPPEKRVRAGDLYLETERHERKVTGSYYTPDDVVNYIVDRTVGPLVRKTRAEAKAGGRHQSDAVLALNVCDPAMGSGHFLVAATEYLASELLSALAEDLEDGLVPAEEYSEETARREVVTHCIYGVDVNPLAVELAKVSLWLSTVARDRPLSFLDHRLKYGNSLVGAHLSELRQYPRSGTERTGSESEPHLETFIPPYYMEALVSEMREIQSLQEETLEDAKLKAESYERFRSTQAYERTKGCADTWTAVFFGNIPAGSDPAARYYDVLSVIDRADQQWAERTRALWFKQGMRLARERGFFHWELEFPDVFLGQDRPGFDVVLGNPPYVRIYRGQLAEEAVDYFFRRFETAYKKFDLYVLFMEQAARLTREGGRWSFIVPDKFLSTPYAERLRELLLEETVREIVDLRDVTVFQEATVANVIPVIEMAPPAEDHRVRVVVASPETSLMSDAHRTVEVLQGSFRDTPGRAFRLDLTPVNEEVISKIQKVSFPLEDLCYVNWGLRTGTKRKTDEMIVREPATARHRPMIWGHDIVDRYSFRYSGWYVDYDPDRLYNPMFPELFEGEKIVIRKISGGRGLMCAVDRTDLYCFSTIIVAKPQLAVPEDKRTRPEVPPDLANHSLSYVACLVNSRLMAFFYRVTLSDRLSVVPNHVKSLPIRRIPGLRPPSESIPTFRKTSEELLHSWLTEGPWSSPRAMGFIARSSSLEDGEAVHDMLSYLGDWMTSNSAAVTAEATGFLTWLETECGVDLGSLSGRSKLERYYEMSFADLVSVLKKNRRRLRSDPGDRGFQERLRREFQASTEKIQAARSMLQAVNLLIDQLVYALYGLTPSEIQIVVSSAG